jgi:hypothetical protein
MILPEKSAEFRSAIMKLDRNDQKGNDFHQVGRASRHRQTVTMMSPARILS